ncbi:ABC transporter permease [Chelatococcus reniformis]|nr:iron ABC transporter permease [Chelatococcus reniformis]
MRLDGPVAVGLGDLDEVGDPTRSGIRPALGWRVAAAAVALLAAAPILTLVVLALDGSVGLWPHLVAHVLPRAAANTALLLAGVGSLAAGIGCGTAWLVTAYRFPGRGVLAWALILPLAIPTYIAAYAYLDVLHPVGPVQSWLRWLLGYQSAREFRLPDIRSMTGCILLLSFVLYPYVYLTTRAMFLTQAATLIDASRTLGASYGAAFTRVALPLARPAIAVGVSLVLMETLNDIGASEFLGIQTLTVSIYATWVNRSDLAGAAQIALVLLVPVAGLVAAERFGRRQRSFAASAQRPRRLEPRPLGRTAGMLALALASLPVLVGFVVPAAYLAWSAWARIAFAGLSQGLLATTWNTVSVSAAGTLGALALGLIVAYAGRAAPGRIASLAARLSLAGYAVPGTVLAIGVLYGVGALDRAVAWAASTLAGASVGLVLIGSGAAMVLAYTLRFLAIATGSVEGGLSRIPPSLDGAARTMGAGTLRTLYAVHLPLAKPALASGAILIFVDCMKELPATLLLRPLNFETLATRLYGEAARGTYEDASIAALLIVLVSLLPVAVLARLGQDGR